MRLIIFCVFSAFFRLFASPVWAENPLGFDMGWSPEQTEAVLAELEINGSQGTWLRIRGMADSEVVRTHDEIGGRRSEVGGGKTAALDPRIQARRSALATLRNRGHRLVAMIRWSNWEVGTRPNPAHLPSDLREAYQRCRDLAYTYGDLIDAWEIDNEPDISFVPENAETFAAFYKACALGILAGRELAESESGISALSFQESREERSVQLSGFSFSDAPAPSAIMHSPMALPPGPYWQELVANDVLSYTEAFNYHFYGYPEDFRGVRDAWVAALEAAQQVGRYEGTSGKVSFTEGTDPETLSPNGDTLRSEIVPSEGASSDIDRPRRLLPIFLTEYGYGLLDRFDRFTVEGRERQKRFFELTLSSITDGAITGAMAFVFMPYYERGMNEFGLLAEVPEGLRPVLQRQQGENLPEKPAKYEGKHPTSPNDQKTDSLVRQSLGDGGTFSNRSDTFPLLTDGNRPSPVVIDFIAGEQTQSVKRYNGHLLRRVEDLTAGNADKLTTETLKSGSIREGEDSTTNTSRPEGVTQAVASKADQEQIFQSTSSGEFTLVLYNFSDEPVTGMLRLSLENGQIAETKPAGRQPGATDVAIAEAQPTEDADLPADSSAVLSAVASAKAEASAEEEKTAEEPPPPYQRPDVPRSSLRPPEERTWPNAGTRLVTTESGKTYAITPALELLLQNAVPSTECDTSGGTKLKSETLKESATRSLRDRPKPVEGSKPRSTNPPTFESNELTLAPMERREFKFTATLPNQEFRSHRMTAIWLPDDESNPSVANPSDTQTDLQTFSPYATHRDEPADHASPGGEAAREKLPESISAFQHFSFQHFDARLATRLYPSPSAFRLRTISAFDFTAKDNADARAQQLARPRAEGEARLYQHPTAQRWLSTPGVEIEETITGWRITVHDLPPEPLRPAEIELPLPADFQLPAGSALSLKYRLIPTEPADSIVPNELSGSALGTASRLSEFQRLQRDPSRFEEFDLNLRDTNGTLWSVWPRLFAHRESNTYLEPLTNFTSMFFSRPSETICQPINQPYCGRGLTITIRARALPITVELTFTSLVTLTIMQHQN